MHIDPYIVLGSAIVGLLVGMTGAGGGALMTPMLILLFGIKPSTAISSDLVAAGPVGPRGARDHARHGARNPRAGRGRGLRSPATRPAAPAAAAPPGPQPTSP